jgi:hypothetical protein
VSEVMVFADADSQELYLLSTAMLLATIDCLILVNPS